MSPRPRCFAASLSFLAALIAVAIPAATADDWPQFRGPNRDGQSAETGLLKQWPQGGPKLLWSREGIGQGNSTLSIADGMVYVTGKFGNEEALSAFDLDGNLKWKTTYGGVWTKSCPDARTTATVVDGKAYLISGAGEVVRIDAKSGALEWKVAARTKFGGETGNWGTAESPLVVDGKVIYVPAGGQTTVVALDAATGNTVWKSECLNDKSGYVAPILAEYNGVQQIVAVTANWVLGVAPADGKILWKVDYHRVPPAKKSTVINCVSPLYHDGQIYVTSGYDDVGIMIQLAPDSSSAKIVWSDPTLDVHHGGVVLVDGFLYGANWLSNRTGNWICLDWKTGKPRYDHHWNGKGSLITADGMLYCYDETKGELALVRATPEKFDLVSSFPITLGNGKHWCHPAISNGRLYLRHGDVLMAFDIRGK